MYVLCVRPADREFDNVVPLVQYIFCIADRLGRVQPFLNVLSVPTVITRLLQQHMLHNTFHPKTRLYFHILRS